MFDFYFYFLARKGGSMKETVCSFLYPMAPFLCLRTFARKSSTTEIFFIFLLQSDDELPMSEMQKNWGVTDFVFEIKCVENYPNFDKSAVLTRHGLSGC